MISAEGLQVKPLLKIPPGFGIMIIFRISKGREPLPFPLGFRSENPK
jgi:hypothetical protein